MLIVAVVGPSPAAGPLLGAKLPKARAQGPCSPPTDMEPATVGSQDPTAIVILDTDLRVCTKPRFTNIFPTFVALLLVCIYIYIYF